MDEIKKIDILGNGNYVFQDIHNAKVEVSINDIDRIKSILEGQYDRLNESVKKIIQEEFGSILHDRNTDLREVRIPHRSKFLKSNLLLDHTMLCLDFGTTYTYLSVLLKDGSMHLVPDSSGRTVVRTAITVTSDQNYYVGNDAIDAANKSTFLIPNLKRYIGSEENLYIFGSNYDVNYLITLFLKGVVRNAREYLDRDFKNLILSIPSNFNTKQESALINCLESFGVYVNRVISESDASSLVVNSFKGQNEDALFLVVDLGGGTFDLSVMESGDGVFAINAIVGDNELGGVDYDYAVEKYIKEMLHEKLMMNEFDHHLSTKIQIEAERAKKALSGNDNVKIIIRDIEVENGELVDFDILLSRAKFLQITKHLNKRIEQHFNKILKFFQKTEHAERRTVLLSGQGAKIFCVKELIESYFGGLPIIDSFQESGVITGTSYYSGVLSGITKDLLLLATNRNAIAISCKFYEKQKLKKDSNLIAYISDKQSDNDQLLNVLEFNTYIPSKQSVTLYVENEATLELSQLSNSSSATFQFEHLTIGRSNESTTCILTIDVDANGKMVLIIGDQSHGNEKSYSLNYWEKSELSPLKLL